MTLIKLYDADVVIAKATIVCHILN